MIKYYVKITSDNGHVSYDGSVKNPCYEKDMYNLQLHLNYVAGYYLQDGMHDLVEGYNMNHELIATGSGLRGLRLIKKKTMIKAKSMTRNQHINKIRRLGRKHTKT